jgi:hypothetical protein
MVTLNDLCRCFHLSDDENLIFFAPRGSVSANFFAL